MFENDVEMYGTQTCKDAYRTGRLFENDVEMYGTQTHSSKPICRACLRMMQKCMVLKQTVVASSGNIV